MQNYSVEPVILILLQQVEAGQGVETDGFDALLV